VVIFNRPTAAFSYFSTYCPAGKVTFTDQSTAAGAPVNNWYWVFEPGFFSAAANPVYTYSTLGASYPISLIIHDMNGCADTIDSTIYVKPGFAFTFTANTTCLGDSTHFQPVNLAAGDSLHELRWTFGEASSGMNNTSSRYQPAHKYANPNTYTVKLKAYNSDNCSDSVFKEVTVHPLPVADFSFNSGPHCDSLVTFQNLCSGNGVSLDSLVWRYGDGLKSTFVPPIPTSVTHHYTGYGYFTASVTAYNHNECASTDSAIVSVACISASFVERDTVRCQNTRVMFADSSSPRNLIHYWKWIFGDGQDTTYTTYTKGISHIYSTPGTFPVTLIVKTLNSSAGISDTSKLFVVIKPSPINDFRVDSVCKGDSSYFINLCDSNGVHISSTRWSFGDPTSGTNDSSHLISPVHKYVVPGNHNVTLITRNNLGCTDTLRKTARVHKLPQAAFTNSTPCERYDIQFFDHSVPGDTNIAKWWWTLGDPMHQYDTLYTSTVSSRFDSAGTYLTFLKVQDHYGCTDTVYAPVTVLPSPIAAFTITDNIDGKEGKIRLNNESSDDAKGFKWIFGNGKTSTEVTPVVTYTSDTQPYTIELITWNAALCYDTTRLTYEFMFDNLFVPNAFSPTNLNGGLGCREFKPKGMNLKDYHVMVFDKWGHLLWESKLLTDDGKGMPADSWDGTFNGEPMAQDVYMWKISATFKNGKTWEGSDAGKGSTTTMGTVTLIR
jgi:PKD repeat protein